ncbi:MAG: YgjV family protein [Clostridia bacterium]|nr:YgjV family protein [Clostridia bacterium]
MTTPEILTLIGQIFGFAAMALIVLSFQCKKPQGLFIVQIGSCCMFILSYLFFGLGGDSAAYSGMAQNSVGLLFRGALALSNKYKKLLSPLVLAGMGALGALVAVLTYPYEAVTLLGRIMPLLPVVANFACMGCMWTKDSNTIRATQLIIISPFWLIYAATLSPVSIAGILTEVFNISSIGVYYLRMWREKKKAAAAL